jgi:hypothetical protein
MTPMPTIPVTISDLNEDDLQLIAFIVEHTGRPQTLSELRSMVLGDKANMSFEHHLSAADRLLAKLDELTDDDLLDVLPVI